MPVHTEIIDLSAWDRFAQALPQASVWMVMPLTDRMAARKALDLAAQRVGAVSEEVLLLGVHDDLRRGLVAVHNQVFAQTPNACEWYGYWAQDAFAGRRWLEVALGKLQSTQSQSQSQLLGFNDGKWLGQIAAFGLAKRAWVKGLYSGAFFFPGYWSHFADCELTLIAKEQGVYAYDPNALLVEVDHDKDVKPVNSEDRSLFRARCHNGFAGRVTRPELLQLIR